MRISDWSSDVCSSDLSKGPHRPSGSRRSARGRRGSPSGGGRHRVFASAFPERVDGEPDNAEPGDDREHGARLRPGARGGLSLAGADLADPPGERPQRGSDDRGPDPVKPALHLARLDSEVKQDTPHPKLNKPMYSQ